MSTLGQEKNFKAMKDIWELIERSFKYEIDWFVELQLLLKYDNDFKVT